MSKPKIITEVIRRYYVQIDDWIYGGPFDTREEAEACLKETKPKQKTKHQNTYEYIPSN
jgi:hypothetical protein